jgi:hypothetical protein
MCACGAETVDALTPGGTVVTLDVDHVFVAPEQPWPRRVFILGVAGGDGGPMVAQATPALELIDGQPRNRRHGPYRRAHSCV